MCNITSFISRQAGDIFTTPLFWACNCEDDYIHPVSQPFCYRCQAQREASLDAHVREVLKFSDLLPDSLVKIVEAAFAEVNPEFNSIPF